MPQSTQRSTFNLNYLHIFGYCGCINSGGGGSSSNSSGGDVQ